MCIFPYLCPALLFVFIRSLLNPRIQRTKTERTPSWIQKRCSVLFFTNFFRRSRLSRVPLPLLHQQTTSWFVPPEWGDRPRREVRLLPLLQKTRPQGNNLWCLITCTTSMYLWSPSVLSNWTLLHHPVQPMVSSWMGPASKWINK